MGGADVESGAAILSAAGIPTFPYPDTAARIFTHMWRYSDNLHGLYETPSVASDPNDDSLVRAAAIVAAAQSAGRTLLTELESKRILVAYGIPTVEAHFAATAAEAVAAAESVGYPVVLKLHSETLTHKTDVGGVALNLADGEAVRRAYDRMQRDVADKAGAEHFLGVTVQRMVRLDGYEVIVGSSVDAQFGPVLLFGSGGKLVEVYRDRALALPPLNTTLARRMMEQTRIFVALGGVRGAAAADLPALERLLVRFSTLVVEQRRIREIEINPLLVSEDRLLALDARVILHTADVSDSELPAPAIRPYPVQYVDEWALRDGTVVTIRPIRPEDEPLMVEFHANISERSVYFRYLHLMGLSQRVAHERLTRVCFIDYAREMALVAEQRDAGGRVAILGVGRLVKSHGVRVGEFAVVVIDARQGQGLGTELLHRIVQVGRDEGLTRIVATIDPDNREMQGVSEKVGFTVQFDERDQVLKATLDL
jgi:acetyltransferase